MKLIVIGSKHCEPCKVLKLWLEIKQIPHEYIDLEEAKIEELKKYPLKVEEGGGLYIPQIFIEREGRVELIGTGLSRKLLRKIEEEFKRGSQEET